MKKITILLMAMMVPMLMQAQAKRRPAGGATAKKPAQKARQKVNSNFAIVQFDEWMKHDVFEDENNVYFLGTTYGENTLRAIDKKTGDIRIVVPKKKRARPQICSAGSNGKDVFMRLEGKGIIQAFRRPENKDASIKVMLRGLKAGAKYELTNRDGGKKLSRRFGIR